MLVGIRSQSVPRHRDRAIGALLDAVTEDVLDRVVDAAVGATPDEETDAEDGALPLVDGVFVVVAALVFAEAVGTTVALATGSDAVGAPCCPPALQAASNRADSSRADGNSTGSPAVTGFHDLFTALIVPRRYELGHNASPSQRASQRHLVGIFQVATNWQTRRRAGHPDAEIAQ